VRLLVDHDALFGPGTAAGLGGVVLSGLERTQNLSRVAWNRERVDRHLQDAMGRIHDSCASTAEEFDRRRDLAAGADIAAFVRVADAMLDQGLV
jgi:glutamate dehydrogenase (NADP+)